MVGGWYSRNAYYTDSYTYIEYVVPEIGTCDYTNDLTISKTPQFCQVHHWYLSSSSGYIIDTSILPGTVLISQFVFQVGHCCFNSSFIYIIDTCMFLPCAPFIPQCIVQEHRWYLRSFPSYIIDTTVLLAETPLIPQIFQKYYWYHSSSFILP